MLDTNAASPEAETALPLSVVVAADGDGIGLGLLLDRYRDVLDGRSEAYEFILVFDHRSDALQAVAAEMDAKWPNFMPLPQRPWAGEDAALKIGVDRTVGETVLTLPSWSEISPGSIPGLLDATADTDMAVARRVDLNQSGLHKARTRALNGLLRLLFQQRFDDIFCRARAGRREVFQRCAELGVRQHFLPLIAASEGYDVREVDAHVDDDTRSAPVYRFKPQAHFGAFADVLTLFVGLKFLKRPLRFFGAVGVPMIALGLLMTLYLVIERLVFGISLADRPALVFSIMTLVLGLQIVALGLVGEIIIFASSRRMRSYEIDQIIRGRPDDDAGNGPPKT